MFQRFHEMRERGERGFTLIELLVVILIIAILAAIAIPVFLSQRRKGWESQQQSTLKDAATAAETFATDNNGDFSGMVMLDLTDAGYVDPTGVYATVTVPLAGATGYCIQSVHDQDVGAWDTSHFLSADGRPTTGACPAALP